MVGDFGRKNHLQKRRTCAKRREKMGVKLHFELIELVLKKLKEMIESCECRVKHFLEELFSWLLMYLLTLSLLLEFQGLGFCTIAGNERKASNSGFNQIWALIEYFRKFLAYLCTVRAGCSPIQNNVVLCCLKCTLIYWYTMNIYLFI